ncbi:MAG: aminotransferase class III-fold pyridoxal phosphate-dependent enzyme, partial [Rhizobium sp.]
MKRNHLENDEERDFEDAEDLSEQNSGQIAIIGMSGRFPGAPSVGELWQMILEGRNAFSRFSPDEIEDAFTDEERAQPNYVAARPHLDGADMFDAEFFGMFPREAAITDPQHRIFLEICWEALEDGGYDPQRYAGPIGVFAGSSMPTYLINNVLYDRAKAEEFTSNYQIGSFHELVGALNDTLATRVAYKFNLRGPAFTLQSACSSSLLAVSQACQNLLTYSCDMALAGGVSVTIPQKRGYLYQEGGMASPDGACRPFDANAAGTVFASGAGVVLLKRYDEALKDGDHIYAVIRGYGINNDGSDKVGFTAPSVEGQAEAIATALANADVDPASIGYIECHGTATPLGDPIEFNGLTRAFAYDVPGTARCALGSVKGTIGHTDCAAGVTGLIKTALALRSATIPPMPNYREPNPRIDLEASPFYIPTTAIDWPKGEAPRRAGVSAFGVGGTNVHVILEEPRYPSTTSKAVEGQYVLPLSARNKAALAQMRANLSDHLAENPKLSVARLAHTLQTGRREFGHRLAIAAGSVEDAIVKLTTESYQPLVATDQPPVAFMFPGQGAQYVGMGAGLYSTEPEFARWIDRGSEILKMSLGLDLRDYICHTGPATQAIADEQRETRIAQPCLYLVEYALARLWLSRGVKPYAMIGHSVGEFVAATLANVISFEDGLRLVANRGRLMQHQPQGAMVSVRADADTTAAHLQGEVEIAAINAPKLCVISGPFGDMDKVCAALSAADIAFSRLHTSHAFHSAMMQDAALALRQETEKVTYGTATIPFISGVTGDWQTTELATSPDYWAMHCRDTVRFADGLATLCRDRKPVLLEIGPGRTLSVFAAQTIARDALAAVVQSLPEHDRASAATATFAEAHGKLWMAGCRLSWPLVPAAARQRLSLPTYPFQRQRHWIDAPPSARRAASRPADTQSTPAGNSLVSDVNLTEENRAMNVAAPISFSSRLPQLETALLTLLSDMSGETLGPDERAATFLELGFDSLFVGQFAQRIEKDFKVKISFRELLSDIPSVADLAAYLDQQMPADAMKAAEPLPAAIPIAAAPMPVPPLQAPTMSSAVSQIASLQSGASDLATVLQSQIQMAQTLFSQQLVMLQAMQGGGQIAAAPAAIPLVQAPATPTAPPSAPASVPAAAGTPAETDFGTERIKLYRPNAKSLAPEISTAKQEYITNLTKAYETKNARSKAFTQDHRRHLADPRSASGFRADWKEMVFPIVCDHSKGAYIWDVDGNRYVDLVNGFGQTAFGHAPDFVIDAVKSQAERGFAIGPQTPLAGDVAKMIAEITGHERVTFCNTGSEAVMAAMRLARAVTGRDRVVVFANDYHGQFDEVLVKGRNRADKPIALPVASGIPMASVSNMTVLRYGAPESLEFIRANATDIAAVIIEPIQSRHPELQPREFVQDLRDIATRSEFALVFDEVVTGFRVDPGGMQAIWGIKGDMATYGKVVGGGMPIGVLVGSPRFMDALDGGYWAYGDSSVPMTAPTFFAGTFVRHPLTLAAANAVLHHIKGEGSALYDRVAERTEALVAEIRADLARRGIADVVHGYKSWFATDFSSQDPLGALFYAQMRLNGVHIQDGYPCFLTTAHSEDDFDTIAKAFRDSLDAMQAVGIFAAKEEISAPKGQMSAPVAKPASAPLTEAQTEIWLAAQAGDEASCSFNESFSLTLEGTLNEKAMRRAFDTVIARHDAFHICFDRGGEHFQFIPDFKLDLPILEGVDQQGLAQIIDDEARTPFDLINGPLVRASIVKLAPEKHVLVFTAHHIICDGWSINTFVEELSAGYDAFKAGGTPDFQPALSFSTYSTDLSPRPEKSQATEQFWLDQFKTVPD